MILVWLIIIPFVGGLLAWLVSRWDNRWSRWVSLAALAINLALVLALWAQYGSEVSLAARGRWLVEINLAWIPELGIRFHLALDGLSLILLLLTEFLGIVAVSASWTDIQERVGFFHFNLLWVLAGITGVFLALDLFLFYFFWELMLVPMYLLIVVWGHERRIYAAIKFFIFTQFSGLLMLVAILGLYFVHGQATGVYTFDYSQLLGTSMSATTAMWLMLGFLIAFAVKLPVVPVHSWQPDAYTQAPTAGSVILAGIMVKAGAYGLLRFVVPLFPQAALAFAPVAMVLAVVGILYGAILAFAQTDLKRLVAYTSISHMGFVLLGIFAWNELALQGVVMQIVAHGISTGALFMLIGALQERTRTRDMRRLGGLWSTVPRMGGVGLLFALALLGLPGLGNFVAEFLILIGAFQANVTLTVLATVGLIAATVYALWMVQQAFHGPNTANWKLPDLGGREMLTMAVMIAVIVWLGLYPQPILNTAKPALDQLQHSVSAIQPSLMPTRNAQVTWPQLDHSTLNQGSHP
jgi:NADH-quinone oxidoreductase subunit M